MLNRGAGVPYHGAIHVCKEHDCLTNRRHAASQVPRFANNALDAATPGLRAWVCQDHLDGAKTWWGLHDRTNFDKSHRVPPCSFHEVQFMEEYPDGHNSCTCENVSFDSWQCRSCFEHKIRKMIENFQMRVDLPFRGDADLRVTRPYLGGIVPPQGTSNEVYWSDWRVVRRMLARVHPCMHNDNVSRCKIQRIGGIQRRRVLDCRCCGGLIVERPRNPNANPLSSDYFRDPEGRRTLPWTIVRGDNRTARRSARRHGGGLLVELDDQGRARILP